MRSLPKAPTHDQCRESNRRPLDLRSSVLPTEVTMPIRSLVNKDSVWICGRTQKDTFKQIKQFLCSTPVLAPYDYS